MNSTKRPRACDACHSIKIKCELGTSGGPGPCERCVRLGKECIITPFKSQKDRVAELEAQVAALTRLLEGQKLESGVLDTAAHPATNATNPAPAAVRDLTRDSTEKKRKLAPETYPEDERTSVSLETLDRLVSLDLQKQLLAKYVRVAVPIAPFVPLNQEWTLERLRETHPVLLQTIVYSMSTGSLPGPDQDKLGSKVLDTFEALSNDKEAYSVELIQAIQIAVLWYRAPKNHRQVAAFQLAQRAANIAKDIGLWGSEEGASIGFTTVNGGTDPAASLRAWLVCYLLSTVIVTLMRKASFKFLDEVDTFSLHMLEYLECAQETDRILCHFVRAETLCERISMDLQLLDFSICQDVSDLHTQLAMQTIQNAILDWKNQIPSSPPSLVLGSYEIIATLYLHETVLHTPTNKGSFSAPYLAERLSITDFPAPITVTEQHIISLHALKDAAQALLDFFSSFDLDTWMTLPFMLYVGRLAYAEYILMKLYIAATAPGNTFGIFLSPESLQLEKYLDTFIQIATSAQQVDSSCPAARILLAPARMKEWLLKYNATNATVASSSDYGSVEVTPTPPDNDDVDWDSLLLGYNDADWAFDGLLEETPALDFASTSFAVDDLTSPSRQLPD